jgi:methionyl-tRNA synthetase
MGNRFYVTTPIYYVNDEPHIGHAYTTILADVLTRYHRMFGDPSYFLTGVDEHGQKVQEAAARRGVSPQQHCDQMAARFTDLWKKLEISNDDFIRTTEKRHQTVVQKVLQSLYQQGQIYSAEYDGWYCTPDERFWTEKDLVNGNCPDCGRPVARITEKNYFFKMAEHQQWLVDEISSGRMTIKPESRKNEVLGFLKKPLNDLCISRPKKRLAWGIELPFDPEYVTYVWFDALINYISALGYLTGDQSKYQEFWPSVLHLLGKDILTTHSVYWPTMLHAMGVKTPQTVLAHGWWLIDDSKMSKSRGTVVRPLDMADRYGVEQFRYFLIKEMTLGADANFSEEALIARINSDLANDYGNLVSRVFKMVESYCGGSVPEAGKIGSQEEDLRSGLTGLGDKVKILIDGLEPNKALEEILEQVRATNRYVESNAPWKLHKEGNQERINAVLYTAAEALRIASILLYPVMPGKCRDLLARLGVAEKDITLGKVSQWGLLGPGQKISAGEPLFPRIDRNSGIGNTGDGTKKKAGKMEEAKPEQIGNSKSEVGAEELIDIDYFKKIKLRTAEIIAAEKVPNADKLLRLQVKLGEETRQVLAGIAQWYTPESLVGQQVIIVANLKPAKIRGLESHGMLLAAQDKDGVVVLTPQRKTDTGSEIR